jgi:hypothetical protein
MLTNNRYLVIFRCLVVFLILSDVGRLGVAPPSRLCKVLSVCM